MNIFLVEHAYQAEDMLKRVGDETGRWIALGPSAMHYLDKKKISYITPEEFCGNNEIESICVEHFEKLSKVCELLDRKLLENDNFMKEKGIRPFLFHLWELGQLVDILASRTWQLKKIFENLSVSKVYVHANAPQSWIPYGIGFSKRETVWANILISSGWEIELKTFSDESAFQDYFSFWKKIEFRRLKDLAVSNFVLRYKSIYHIIRCWQIMGKSACASFLRKKNSQRNLFVILNEPYEWSGLIPDLIKSGNSFHFIDGRSLGKYDDHKKNVENPSDLAKSLWGLFGECFVFNNIDCSLIMRGRYHWVFDIGPVVARKAWRELESCFASKKVTAVLTSVGCNLYSYVARKYFEKRAIPVLSWQHGAEWYDKRITQRNDLFPVNNHKTIVFGDGVKRGYDLSGFMSDNKVVSAGSLTLDALRHKEAKVSKTKKILCVFTCYYYNAWYCGFSPPYNDRLYFKEQVELVNGLVKLLKQYPDIAITLKMHTSADVLSEHPPWLSELEEIKRLTILTKERSFVDLLSDHQIVIVDIPTTTLLQAIATDLPVFVSMSNLQWPNDAMKYLIKRAVCAENAANLIDKLGSYLKTGVYQGDLTDNNFIKSYGTYLDDGKTKQRVIEIVREVCHATE